MLTPRQVDVKLGRRRNYLKGRAAIRQYANQPCLAQCLNSVLNVKALEGPNRPCPWL